jgi:hypothetical protein
MLVNPSSIPFNGVNASGTTATFPAAALDSTTPATSPASTISPPDFLNDAPPEPFFFNGGDFPRSQDPNFPRGQFPPGQFPPEPFPPRPFPPGQFPLRPFPPGEAQNFQGNRPPLEFQRFLTERAAFLQANGVSQTTTTTTTTTPIDPSTNGTPSTGTATTRVNDPNKITVAQIDSFVPDSQNFNHGQEIAKTMNAGGADPSLAGKITILRYSVDGNGTLAQTLPSKTADALQDIVNRVKAGQDIDAVNISLQDFVPSTDADRARTLIRQLAQMNVAVDVAAGNGGPTQVNQLATPDAFVVQSSTNGKLNATSSLGNITAEASTTSFSTANLTPRIAAMMNSGMTLNQVRALANIAPIS